MFKKILGTIICAAIACAALTGCAGSGKKKVGISMPTQDLQRWNQDGAYMKEKFEAAGAVFAGTSPDNRLVEEMELLDEDFYLGVQYHPEFKSRPDKAHPLFKGFIREAGKRHGHS